jgi:hypothetical protein
LKWFKFIHAPFNPDLKVGENKRLQISYARHLADLKGGENEREIP